MLFQCEGGQRKGDKRSPFSLALANPYRGAQWPQLGAEGHGDRPALPCQLQGTLPPAPRPRLLLAAGSQGAAGPSSNGNLLQDVLVVLTALSQPSHVEHDKNRHRPRCRARRATPEEKLVSRVDVHLNWDCLKSSSGSLTARYNSRNFSFLMYWAG